MIKITKVMNRFFKPMEKNNLYGTLSQFKVHYSKCCNHLCIFHSSSCPLERKFIQRTFLKFIPAPLIVVLIGILVTLGMEGTGWAIDLQHRVDLGIAGKPMKAFFTFPDFSQLATNKEIYIIAITIAVVASLETLLSVEASDKLDPKKRVTPGNRELIAQGTGNILSGLIGGLPITQVVVRTSANINSGGTNKLAAISHGIFIALAVMLLPSVFGFIPYASLAAILIQVGFKLAKPSLFKKVYKEGWLQFIPFLATIGLSSYLPIY